MTTTRESPSLRVAFASLLLGVAAIGLSCGGGGDGLSEDARRQLPGEIAFLSERAGSTDLYLVRPSGEGLQRFTHSESIEYPVRLIPGDSLLLTISVGEDSLNHWEQFVLLPLNPDKEAHGLDPASYRIRDPSVTPDGEWLVFDASYESYRDIFRLQATGDSLQQLTDDEEGNFSPDVSPNGRQIVFTSSRDQVLEIYRMNADGSEQERLTHFHKDDWLPRWSPDGQMIAFLSEREGADRVFVMRANGDLQRKLNAAKGEASEGVAKEDSTQLVWQEAEHVWSPSGEEIAYVKRHPRGPSQVWVTNVETGEQRQISPDDGRDSFPAWSPDGRYLVFASEGPDGSNLYLVRSDGSGRTRITDAPGSHWLPRWLPIKRERLPGHDDGADPQA